MKAKTYALNLTRGELVTLAEAIDIAEYEGQRRARVWNGRPRKEAVFFLEEVARVERLIIAALLSANCAKRRVVCTITDTRDECGGGGAAGDKTAEAREAANRG